MTNSDPIDPTEPAAPRADGEASPGAAGDVPVRIRPAVAAVLAVGALIAVGALLLDPPPAWRYGLVGVIAVLYFVTKVRHWL